MTPSDLAHVTTAAEKLGRTDGGCKWLRMIASSHDRRLRDIAAAALHRSAAEGYQCAIDVLAKMAEADAVPERVT